MHYYLYFNLLNIQNNKKYFFNDGSIVRKQIPLVVRSDYIENIIMKLREYE